MTTPGSDPVNGAGDIGGPLTGKNLEELLASPESVPAASGSGFHHRLGVIELRFTQVMVGAMTCLVLASAVTRSIGRPMAWTVDLALLAFAWAVFVGADVALRNGRMVNIDLVIRQLPVRAKAFVELANTVLIMCFLVAMVALGFTLSYTTRSRSFSGLPWLSYTWATLAVPVGCALMCWTVWLNLRAQARVLRHGSVDDEEDEQCSGS